MYSERCQLKRGETPPAIAIAECEKAEGARAEGGERKRKREGCGL